MQDATSFLLSPLQDPSAIDTLGYPVCLSPSLPNNCCSQLPLAHEPRRVRVKRACSMALWGLHPELPKPQQTKQATYWDMCMSLTFYIVIQCALVHGDHDTLRITHQQWGEAARQWEEEKPGLTSHPILEHCTEVWNLAGRGTQQSCGYFTESPM